MKIEFVHRKDLDTHKWNKAIFEALNARVYATSPLLDAMCNNNWHALVNEDFSIVMPITDKQKFLIPVINQPYFLQQLGIFYTSNNIRTNELFLQYIYEKYKKVNIYFTSELDSFLTHKKNIGDVLQRTNYLLPLDNNYNNIYAKFSSNCKRNLKKTSHIEVKEIPIGSYEEFYIENKLYINAKIKPSDLSNLIYGIQNNQNNFTYKVYAVYIENNICSAAIYLKYKNRFTYISGGSNTIGIENKGMFAIKNFLIKNNAETDMFLDFEGSNIPSIASFFEGFGATKEIYMHWKFNKIPFNKLLNKFL